MVCGEICVVSAVHVTKNICRSPLRVGSTCNVGEKLATYDVADMLATYGAKPVHGTPPHSVDTRRSGTSIPILLPSRRAIHAFYGPIRMIGSHFGEHRGKVKHHHSAAASWGNGAHERAFSGVGKFSATHASELEGGSSIILAGSAQTRESTPHGSLMRCLLQT